MFYGTQKLFCPVHPKDDGFLGNRKKELGITLKCDECGFYFYFPPHSTIPTKATPARKVEIKCGCEGCKDRDARARRVE